MYSTPEIDYIWSDGYMLRTWAEIERHVLVAQAETDTVPTGWSGWVRAAHSIPAPSVYEWRDRTAECGHEVVAFLELWGEAGVNNVHIGLTSSDLTDTTLGVRIAATNTVISNGLARLVDLLQSLRFEYATQPRLGRTHGQPAVPTTYGHLFDVWCGLVASAQARLTAASKDAAIGKISGPVGNYLHTDRRIEAVVCARLGLRTPPAATQIVPRDMLARWVAELGVVATVLEAIAVELRLLSHAQIGEVYVRNGSTSSAMPHKNNPNQLERLTGLARIVRSAYDPIAQGVVQWHERDMAHSSVERVLVPQAAGAVGYAVETLITTFEGLRVDSLRATYNLTDYEVETQTHSIQTHMQLNGMSYVGAKAATLDLYRNYSNPQSFRLAVQQHPLLSDYKPPHIYERDTDVVL